MSDSDDDPEISDLELDFSDAGTNKKKKKKKKKKEKKKKKDKPEQIVWEEYIEYNELGQEVIRFKHKKSGEIIDDCPGQLYHKYWIEAKNEEGSKRRQERDKKKIREIELEIRYLSQSVHYNTKKIEFGQSHGIEDNLPHLIKEKEALIASKQQQIKEKNQLIFAIKEAEANREQTWRNTQSGEITHTCPEKIRYKYWVEGIDQDGDFCKATEDFPGDNPDEDLSFKKHNWIEILNDEDEDWWNGRLWLEGKSTKQTGNFPVDVVERIKRPQWVNPFLKKTVYKIPENYRILLEAEKVAEAKRKKEGILAPPGSAGEGMYWAEMEDDDNVPYWYDIQNYTTTYDNPLIIPTPPPSPRQVILEGRDMDWYTQITLEDGSRYWYEMETAEDGDMVATSKTQWTSPYDPRDPPDRWYNNFKNGDFYWVDYENVRISMDKPEDLLEWEYKLERDATCLELMWGNNPEYGKLWRYNSDKDYLVDMVERNIHCMDAIEELVERTEIIIESLELQEVVVVMADMVRQVSCIEVIDHLVVELEAIAEAERLAALAQAGDDDPNDRDLEPEWLDMYTLPQSVPYVEKFALREWFQVSSGTLWVVNNGWRQFHQAYNMKLRVENRYKTNIAKLEERDQKNFKEIELRRLGQHPTLPKLSNTNARWLHDERMEKLDRDRENLKEIRAVEREDTSKVPHKFYQVSGVDTWYGVIVKDFHVVGINLNKNDLEGQIPVCIKKMTHITSLCLNRNRLEGQFPEAILELCTLQTLDLHGNELTGILPSAISQLHNLKFCYLQKNKFYGPIGNICTLTAVKDLDLSSNEFGVTSGLPTEGNLSISKMKRLEKLNLSHNKLVGSFHEKICRLTRLKELRLDGNDIAGPIPTDVYKMVDLQVLSVDHNRLYGEIPESIRKLKKLERLWLGSNKFSGNIPSWLPKLRKLTTLDLHDNHFSGFMLPTLAQLTKLEILRLDFNYFEGNVPFGYARLLKLVEFDVGDGAVGNNEDVENLPVTLSTLEEWRKMKAPPIKEELTYRQWLDVTRKRVVELRHSRREEIAQGEAHKLVRNRRKLEKQIFDLTRDNRTKPPFLKPLKLQSLFSGGAPTNTRNDGEGRPHGWIPANIFEVENAVGWSPGYPTVLANDLNDNILYCPPTELPKYEKSKSQAFRTRLEAWAMEKMELFDKDEAFRKERLEKYRSREMYEEHVWAKVEERYSAFAEVEEEMIVKDEVIEDEVIEDASTLKVDA